MSTGVAKLKNGWYQTGIKNYHGGLSFVKKESGDRYNGRNEPDQNG